MHFAPFPEKNLPRPMLSLRPQIVAYHWATKPDHKDAIKIMKRAFMVPLTWAQIHRRRCPGRQMAGRPRWAESPRADGGS